MYICICMCICMCIYQYIYIYIHIPTYHMFIPICLFNIAMQNGTLVDGFMLICLIELVLFLCQITGGYIFKIPIPCYWAPPLKFSTPRGGAFQSLQMGNNMCHSQKINRSIRNSLSSRWLLGGSSHLVSKWVITPVISGQTPLIPFITRVVTHLLSGMSHQQRYGFVWRKATPRSNGLSRQFSRIKLMQY